MISLPTFKGAQQALWVFIFVFIVFGFIVLLPGCQANNNNVESQEDSSTGNGDEKPEEIVNIAYVEWASEIASSHVVKAVIEEKLGHNCQLLPVTAIAMWESVAAGDQDAMVAAWLPSLHEHYYEEHKNQIENLGPNLEGAVMGLVVPDYVPVYSIDELNEQSEIFHGNIIGIDPEAGIMAKTENVIDEYNLNNFDLITGSDATMTTTLENAIDEESPIVITGWTPHWKFARWDLRYLEDPQNAYGGGEHISTIVRQGLKEDLPEVYNFLDNFYWQASDMEEVMLWIREEGTNPEEAATRWIRENDDIVEQWLE